MIVSKLGRVISSGLSDEFERAASCLIAVIWFLAVILIRGSNKIDQKQLLAKFCKWR
jgi:hypothetical protein